MNNSFSMTTFITAGQLSSYISKNTNTPYKPFPESIHVVLKRHGLLSQTKYYNGRSVQVYDANNAKRVVFQNIAELKKEDDNIKNRKQYPRQKFVPRKHGETNAMRQLDKETLWESRSAKRLRCIIKEELENNCNPEYVLSSPFTWRDVDFIEDEIEADGCERLIVTIKGCKIPIDIINLKAQQTRLGKIQLHIFIDNNFQKQGIATKIYTSFIHQFGGIYSGFGRMMNKPAILSIYNKLQYDKDITVKYVTGYGNEIIGIEAFLNQKEQS